MVTPDGAKGSKMPPEVYHSHSLNTPNTPLLSRVAPKSRFKQILHRKYCQGGGGRMKFTKRNLVLPLVFILCGASIFRFLNISMVTSSFTSHPVALPPIHPHECSSASSVCGQNISHPRPPPKGRSMSENTSSLTEKEMRFLWEFLSHRVPCNLLVFGFENQYSSLASMNAGGVTVFLEESFQKTSAIKSSNNTQVHKIMYTTHASEAYKLLKDARENPNCSPKIYFLKASKCNLGLSNLPRLVYDTMWDVVIVDGPRGDRPDSPGRMASIYTASVLARRGNTTHVIVHDVDRMIEKWFSREFLCEENLVSSKGRIQHFQIPEVTNATTFCAP
ncbi:protein IRREGULAR XYLEM 15 [Sesamum alatum]|uniref:Protein IRREGULAR XYLEM 15 n=1 Tax=Sesamum alatum TaxID=300844 RepID=A0AAE2CW67_9LAMI|nr:protein IRREGULAR XYLEM 15 [Sesamum alatum]